MFLAHLAGKAQCRSEAWESGPLLAFGGKRRGRSDILRNGSCWSGVEAAVSAETDSVMALPGVDGPRNPHKLECP